MTSPYPDELLWDDILKDWFPICLTEEKAKEIEEQRQEMELTYNLERYNGLI